MNSSFEKSRLRPVHIAVARTPADGAFHSAGAAFAALNNPFQYAHVIAEARPYKVAIGIFRNQLTPKIRGCIGQVAAKLQPVVEVVADVVAQEWQHGEGVAAHFAQFAKGCGSGHFAPMVAAR